MDLLLDVPALSFQGVAWLNTHTHTPHSTPYAPLETMSDSKPSSLSMSMITIPLGPKLPQCRDADTVAKWMGSVANITGWDYLDSEQFFIRKSMLKITHKGSTHL